jgi:protein-disulfide isomerase
MVGIGQASDTTPDIPPSNLCSNLFEATSDVKLPIAVFTDYYCPYCRGLSDRLIERSERQDLHLTWHELPLLGAGSLRSARAAVAAAQQGAYLPVHKHLMDTVLRPSQNTLRVLAEQFELDIDQFMADHNGPLPDQHFERSRGLARLLGLPGTPSTVVGRTVVIGAIDDRQLDRLIDLERGLQPACV